MKATDFNPRQTVGILFCGELGSAFAQLLDESELRVVTTCEHRSRCTQKQSQASGIEILPTFDDVVIASDIVFAFVVPSAASDVAQRYAERCYLRSERSIYVDVNSIGIEAVATIAELMAKHSILFVDATIHGGAKHLKDIGVMYVSGPDTSMVEDICRGILQVHRLGDQPGLATRMKLLMAGMSKSLNALFLQIGVMAQSEGMSVQFLESCHLFYPGIMTAVERMLPTYPRHAVRRVEEMENVQEMAQSSGLQLGMIDEAIETIKQIAAVDWDGRASSLTTSDIPEIINLVAQAYHSKHDQPLN